MGKNREAMTLNDGASVVVQPVPSTRPIEIILYSKSIVMNIRAGIARGTSLQ